MTHEKIIKDERGTIRLVVKLWNDEWGRTTVDGKTFDYRVEVWVKPPRKRTERILQTKSLAEGLVTPQEIFEAKLEFWNLIKPTI